MLKFKYVFMCAAIFTLGSMHAMEGGPAKQECRDMSTLLKTLGMSSFRSFYEQNDDTINQKQLENQKQLTYAIQESNVQKVEQCLINGADANLKTHAFNFPLFHVLSMNQISFSPSIMELLLRYGADPNTHDDVDMAGNKSLAHLIYTYTRQDFPLLLHIKPKYLYAIKLLLYHGANPYNKQLWSNSAIDIAKENNATELVTLLTNAQKNLIKNLHALLSRGQTPFPSKIALKIAQFRYDYNNS